MSSPLPPAHAPIDAENVIVGPAVGVDFSPTTGTPVSVSSATTGSAVVVVGAQGEQLRLDELADVDSSQAPMGVPVSWVLGVDKVWRPIEAYGLRGDELAYAFVQTVPSSIWLISHPLSFSPAGIEVTAPGGQQLHPSRVVRSAGNKIRLEFGTSLVRGTALFS